MTVYQDFGPQWANSIYKEDCFVNVLWINHTVEKENWKWEEEMRSKYPHLCA